VGKRKTGHTKGGGCLRPTHRDKTAMDGAPRVLGVMMENAGNVTRLGSVHGLGLGLVRGW
jgi:hypothetical protein